MADNGTGGEVVGGRGEHGATAPLSSFGGERVGCLGALSHIIRTWEGASLPSDHDLTPAWLLLLFADGSPTRQLALLTGSPLRVDIRSSRTLHEAGADVDADDAVLVGLPCVRREVWLENERGERLGHAVSWWRHDDLRTFLPDPGAPIGGNMAASRLDVHRELLRVQCGHDADLERGLLGVGGEGGGDAALLLLWSRTYRMWHGGRVISVITETFSPALEKWMGPPVDGGGGGGHGGAS